MTSESDSSGVGGSETGYSVGLEAAAAEEELFPERSSAAYSARSSRMVSPRFAKPPCLWIEILS